MSANEKECKLLSPSSSPQFKSLADHLDRFCTAHVNYWGQKFWRVMGLANDENNNTIIFSNTFTKSWSYREMSLANLHPKSLLKNVSKLWVLTVCQVILVSMLKSFKGACPIALLVHSDAPGAVY